MNKPRPSADHQDFSNDVYDIGSETVSLTLLLASQFTGQAASKWDQPHILNVLCLNRRCIYDLNEIVTAYHDKNGNTRPGLGELVSEVIAIAERAKEVLGVLIELFGNLKPVCLDDKTINAALNHVHRDISQVITLIEDYCQKMENQEGLK